MQREFSRALLDPDAPMPVGIVGPDGKPSEKRFGVYRNNVMVGLIEAMEMCYPTIQKIIGDEYFGALAKTFVRQSPPKTPMMFEYADDFPQFLQAFDPLSHLPYLADVARLERDRRQSYHAADCSDDGAQELAAIAPKDLPAARLTLHPAMRILTSEHPIFSIWYYNNVAPDQITSPQEDVLVTRPALDVLMRVIPAGTAVFLTSLAQGDALGMAAELAMTANPEFDLAANLGDILQAKIIIDAKA